jgi:ABC-type antimicrobial peptide transport system permease subunit
LQLPSVLLSLFRNRKHLYFLIGLIVLVTVSIILVSVLTIYISQSELRAWEKPLSYFSIIEPNLSFVDNNYKNKLFEDSKIKTVIEFKDSIISVPGILNTEYRPVLALENKDFEVFMNEANLKLVSGKIPQSNTRDIIISENIAEKKNLEVSDYVGHAINNEEFLWGRFEISGIFQGELDIALASLKYFERRLGEESSLLVLPENNHSAMNTSLFNLKNNNYNIETQETLIKNNNKKNKDLLDLIYILIAILTVSLTIIVGLYISLYLKTRLREFALYYSRGISRFNIVKFVLKELLLVTIISQLLGILVSYSILFILRKIIFSELIFLAQISIFDILLILPLFISIILVSFVLAFNNLKTKKLESIIMGG